MNTENFTEIVRTARQTHGLSAAEMDYFLSVRDETALCALADAAYCIATQHLPAVVPGASPAELTDRYSRGVALLAEVAPQIDAMAKKRHEQRPSPSDQ